MNKRTFTIAELEDADYDEVATEPWRHGTRETIVAHVDGKHWRFVVRVHHDEGWQDEGPIEATEVHQAERVVKVWEPVP